LNGTNARNSRTAYSITTTRSKKMQKDEDILNVYNKKENI